MAVCPARRWTIAAVVAAAALALTACGGSAGSGAPPEATPAGASLSTASSTTGSAAPVASSRPGASAAEPATPAALAFTANTVEGEPFDAGALTGKPVVFWFWAPWCTVCRAESPDVAKVAAEFKDRVTFVGIAGLGPLNDMQAFVSETATGGFTHLADVDGSLWARFGVVAQPSFVFVTQAGEAQEFTGGLSERDLRDAANQLLAS